MSTKTIRDVAFELYKPPFYFRGGYVWDSGHHMVLDQHTEDGDTSDAILARIRGWGRIQYMDKPELRAAALQDEVGKLVAEALNAAWERQSMEDAASVLATFAHEVAIGAFKPEELAPAARLALSRAGGAAQVQQEPRTLTDERIKEIFARETGFILDDCKMALLDFARAVLAAHTGEVPAEDAPSIGTMKWLAETCQRLEAENISLKASARSSLPATGGDAK